MNLSLFDEKDFWVQILLTHQRELSVAVVGNKWWEYLTSRIRSAADYSRLLNLDILAAHKIYESKVLRTNK